MHSCLDDLAEDGQKVKILTVVRWGLEQYDELERGLKDLAAAGVATRSLSGVSSLRLEDSASHVKSRLAGDAFPWLDLKDAATTRHSTCVTVQELISLAASSCGTSGGGNNKGASMTPSRVSGSSSGSKNTASLTVTYMNDEQVWSLRRSWYRR